MIKRDLYYDRIPTKSLRDDVRYLGNILGRVIKNQEGQKFFDLVVPWALIQRKQCRLTAKICYVFLFLIL